MELIQLERFKKVAQLENITLAAQQLYISQPGLSKTISNLEKEFDVKLFNRGNNSITLTEAGKTLLINSEKVFASVRELQEIMSQFSEQTHKLSFCAPSYNIIRYLMPVFYEMCPGIEFLVDVVESDKIAQLLINKEKDIAMLYETVDGDSKIFNMPILEDRLLAIVPKVHPLAKKKSIRIKDLADYDVLRLNNTDYLSEHLNRLLKKNNITINFHYIEDPILCRDVIKNSNYLSFTSTLAQNYFAPPLDKKVLIPIADKEAKLTCYIAYNKENSMKISAFKKFIRENYKTLMGC